jgi:DNA-binding HxlR family transcriptional regulator
LGGNGLKDLEESRNINNKKTAKIPFNKKYSATKHTKSAVIRILNSIYAVAGF